MEVKLWNERKTLDLIFDELKEIGLETIAIREIIKYLVIKRNIEQNNIQIKASADEIFQAFCQNFGAQTEEQINEFLKQGNETKESLCEKLILQEKLSSLRMLIGSPEAINQAFVQNKEQFDLVAFELIVVSNESIANELYSRILEKNENFLKLASEFSHSPENVVGPISLVSLSPELRKVALTLSENEVSKPFKVQSNQFVLMKLRRLQRAQLNQKIAIDIQNRLFDEWLNKQIDSANIEFAS